MVFTVELRIECQKRAVHELGSPSQAQWNCGHWWEGGWQFPGTLRGLSHLLYFSQWFLSLEGSHQAFRSPLPRRMFAKQLQPAEALSTVKGGNSINFLACLQENTRSIFVTEETLWNLLQDGHKPWSSACQFSNQLGYIAQERIEFWSTSL